MSYLRRVLATRGPQHVGDRVKVFVVVKPHPLPSTLFILNLISRRTDLVEEIDPISLPEKLDHIRAVVSYAPHSPLLITTPDLGFTAFCYDVGEARSIRRPFSN